MTTPAFMTRHPGVGLALLRVVTGIVYLVHGGQKLFVFGFSGVAGGFASMGAPFPGITGPAIGILEFVGGIALLVGILTRPIALLLAADMLGAIVLVHSKGGFFVPSGIEFVMLLGTAALTLAVAGPGAWAADDANTRRRP